MIEDIARVKEINVLISQLENEKKAIQDKHKSSIVTVAHAGGYIGLGVNLVELLIDCPDTKYLVLWGDNVASYNRILKVEEIQELITSTIKFDKEKR